MSTEHEKDYYDQASHWGAGHFDHGFERERLEASVGLVPGEIRTVLDLGAGDGSFLRILEERRDELWIMGIERSAAAIQASRCVAPIIQGSANGLPFSDRAFDLVSALDMIEHLPFDGYERALDEIRRVASRYVLIGVPYRERRLRAVCPYCACEFNPHYHMRSYDDDSLANLFEDFQVAASAKIYRDESIARVLARPFRYRVFSGFPATAICPQCGFRNDAWPDPGARPDDEGLGFTKALIKRLADGLVKVRVPAEIAVLFERTEP